MKSKLLVFSLFLISFLFVIIMFFSNQIYLKRYSDNYNQVVANILYNIKETLPDVTEEDVIEILNKENVDVNNDYLKKYGIDLKGKSLSISNQNIMNNIICLNLGLCFLYVIILSTTVVVYNYIYNKRIKEITKYVEEINRKNYSLDLLSNDENNLSILKNEIYKTMVMLKSVADNSTEDKLNLKKSLSDISHQLKTPLTSISIMLDNIIDDDAMAEEVRKDFILDIKREITNINFLIYTLLKLSRFDTNSVVFKEENIRVDKLIEEVKKNVSILVDLKNISIKVSGKKMEIVGDFKWEVEALTNIVKNCIEHSKVNGVIEINYNDTKLFNEIVIKDYGEGMSEEALKHIFERFYKVNENDNGFGIGLNLAKTIIEHDNGIIKVSSEVLKGTTFAIRYLKK